MQPEAGIFAQIADALESDWTAAARPNQRPPLGDDWSIWLILAARGFGKTRTGAEWVRSLAESATVERIALVGPTAADVRDTMIEGDSGLISIAPNSNRPIYEPSKRRLYWPSNGVSALAFSSEEPERLRGPQFGAAWCDELGAWRNVKDTWDMLQFGLRLGRNPRQVITTTPKPIAILKDLVKREGRGVVVTCGRTADNAANLAPTFLSSIVSRYAGTRLGRQELDAELLEDTPGALWSPDLLEKNRHNKAEIPPLRRIVVAIDPAVSTGDDADETGIAVCGLGTDDKGYLLEDVSGRLAPIERAQRAVALYRRYSADRIVAEANQGGALVEATIRTVDPNASFKSVHASKGKITRAEPIAALAEQHRILHVGTFPELEDQLCSFAGGPGNSPDRLDAYVWGFTELMLGVTNTGWIDYARSEAEAVTKAGRSTPIDGDLTVRLIAPAGIGAFQSCLRHHVNVPPNRIVTMTPEEAVTFLRSGWKRAGEQA